MSKVTIKKIAEDLGLSRNTVSMAFNGDPKVAPETRQRIISYALSVGYTKLSSQAETSANPEHPLRILVLRRADQTAYWDRIINGISEEAVLHNCMVNISTVTEENIAFRQLPTGYTSSIDACIFLHKFGEDYNRMLLGSDKIGIFLDCMDFTQQDAVLGDVIKSEGRRSIMQLTLSLINQGYRKIGFMCPYYINAETFYDRYEGFCAAMKLSNLPVLPEYVITSSPYMDKSISFQAALDSYPDIPEAIVCANDDSAFRISSLLMERGLKIPDDVAITGFDNDEFDAFSPFFTTVDCNAFILGHRMVQQLIWRMNHPDAPFETITISSTPIYRRSSQKGR